jgi:hypothetical protein
MSQQYIDFALGKIIVFDLEIVLLQPEIEEFVLLQTVAV